MNELDAECLFNYPWFSTHNLTDVDFPMLQAIPSSLPEAPANLSASEMVKIRKALAAGVDAFLAVAMTCFCLTLAELKARRLMRRRVSFVDQHRLVWAE